MPINSGAFGGAEALHISFVSDDGFLNGFAALETTDTGDASGMLRVRGVHTVPNPSPGLNRQPVEGDDYRIDTIDYVSGDIQSGIIEVAIEDFDLEMALINGDVYTLNALYDMILRGVSDPDLSKMALLLTRKAKSQDTGNRGQKKYKNMLYMNTTLYPMGEDQSTYQTNARARFDTTFNPFTTLPWGADIDATNFSVEDGIVLVWYSDHPCHIVAFVGDGTATAIPLDYAPIDAAHTTIIKNVSGTLTIASASSVSVGSKTATPAASVASGARGLIIYEVIRFPKQ